MAKDREVKTLHLGSDVPLRIQEGARQLYEAVKTTYGPKSGNVILEKNWGPPVLTKDGVTVAREIDLPDSVENAGAQLLKEASKKTNDLGGDGTTATVILGYHILEKARQRAAAGENVMDLRRGIEEASVKVVAEIEGRSVPASDEQKLVEIATIAAADPALGELIARTIIDVGEEGGVTVEEYEGLGVEQEIVDGFYFDKGFHSPYMATNDTADEAIYSGVRVLVLEKAISTNADIVPLLEKLHKGGVKELLILADIQGDALATLAMNKVRGVLSSVSVPPAAYSDQRQLFLEDAALLTGGRMILSAEKLEGIDLDEDLGTADRVVVDRNSTTIIGGRGNEKEIWDRIKQIKQALKKEDNEFYRERYGARLGRLSGKIGLIRVGGATPTEMKEKKFRVDDAVNATRAAREEGIVVGGGKTLVNVAASLDPLSAGEEAVQDALVEPFRQLQLNAGENADYRLGILQNQHKESEGYDLNGDEIVNLMERGIVDPTKVIRLVVENACSFAGNAITTLAAVSFQPKDAPPEPEGG